MLTLVADAQQPCHRTSIPSALRLRRMAPSDAPALGPLYFESYDPGISWSTLQEAADDTDAWFNGEYGSPWWDGSLVVQDGDNVVAAVFCVQRAPWPDTPDCPFVTDLFTDRRYRRRGLAQAMLTTALDAAATIERPQLSLRVLPDNGPALALYRSLGFVAWDPPDGCVTRPETPAARPDS